MNIKFKLSFLSCFAAAAMFFAAAASFTYGSQKKEDRLVEHAELYEKSEEPEEPGGKLKMKPGEDMLYYKEGVDVVKGKQGWCLKNDKHVKLNCRAIVRDKDGNLWEGDYTNGSLNGSFEVKLVNGNVYKRIYTEGMAGDQMRIIYSSDTPENANVYCGEWKAAKGSQEFWKNGYGTMFYRNGNALAGHWKDDKLDTKEKVRITYSNKNVYEGYLKESAPYSRVIDLGAVYSLDEKQPRELDNAIVDRGTVYNREGQGTLKFADGRTYTGTWKNDTMEGYGIMTSTDGSVYTGYWKNCKKNGKGKMTYTNGDTYEGDWKDDAMKGEGTMIYVNGDGAIYAIYVGEWKNSARHGYGKITYIDEKTKEVKKVENGRWISDMFMPDLK